MVGDEKVGREITVQDREKRKSKSQVDMTPRMGATKRLLSSKEGTRDL